MRNPGGYSVIVSPDPGFVCLDTSGRKTEMTGNVTELDSFTCFHCGSVKLVKPREDPANLGGLCKQCMKLICPKCVGLGHCDPLEKKLIRAESRDIALRSYGL